MNSVVVQRIKAGRCDLSKVEDGETQSCPGREAVTPAVPDVDRSHCEALACADHVRLRSGRTVHDRCQEMQGQVGCRHALIGAHMPGRRHPIRLKPRSSPTDSNESLRPSAFLHVVHCRSQTGCAGGGQRHLRFLRCREQHPMSSTMLSTVALPSVHDRNGTDNAPWSQVDDLPAPAAGSRLGLHGLGAITV